MKPAVACPIYPSTPGDETYLAALVLLALAVSLVVLHFRGPRVCFLDLGVVGEEPVGSVHDGPAHDPGGVVAEAAVFVSAPVGPGSHTHSCRGIRPVGRSTRSAI